MAAESKTKHYVNVFLRYFVLILVGLIMNLSAGLDGWCNF